MKKRIGENCTKNDDCKLNNCFNSRCIYNHGWTDNGEDCSKDNECASLNCENGKCSNGKLYFGEMCDDNRNCASNKCVDSICTFKVNLKSKTKKLQCF
jgi:hypothetical protein